MSMMLMLDYFLRLLAIECFICEHPMPDLRPHTTCSEWYNADIKVERRGNKTISSFLHSVIVTRVCCSSFLSLAHIKICISGWWIGGGADPWLVFDARLFVWSEESSIWQLLIDTWPTLWPFVEVSRPGIMRTNAPTFSDNRPTFRDYCPASILSVWAMSRELWWGQSSCQIPDTSLVSGITLQQT